MPEVITISTHGRPSNITDLITIPDGWEYDGFRVAFTGDTVLCYHAGKYVAWDFDAVDLNPMICKIVLRKIDNDTQFGRAIVEIERRKNTAAQLEQEFID